MSGIGRFAGGDLLGSAGGDNGTARISALRPQVDNIIRGLDKIEIVFYYYYGVPGIDKPLKHAAKLVYILGVEPRSRLVKYIQGFAGGYPRKLRRQLYPLRLTSGKWLES